MKRITFIALAFIALSTTSCKKDWICQCTDENGDKSEIEIPNSRRPEASIACDFYEGFGEDCSLK